MKKLLLTVALLLLPTLGFGIDWKHTNSITVSWDPVTSYEDGTPLPADAVVRYALFTKEVKAGTILELPGLLTATTGTITFTTEGRYWLGLKAVRLDADVIVSESIVIWSDQPEYCKDGNTFGAMFFKPHKTPSNMRSP